MKKAQYKKSNLRANILYKDERIESKEIQDTRGSSDEENELGMGLEEAEDVEFCK